MAVRLASDTIRSLYAIQCLKKDIKHRSQSPIYKNKIQELWKVGKVEQTLPNSFSSSNSHKTPTENLNRDEKQRRNTTSENALVHKIHRNDRPLRNKVPERAKCDELDDILAKWNVYKPKK